MTTTVEAIYENGRLVLLRPLPLPEKSHVVVTIETAAGEGGEADRDAWLRLSEQALNKVWNNPDDDVFNELLSK